MSITKLNYNQINTVAGGHFKQDMEHAGRCLMSIGGDGRPFFMGLMEKQCISTVTTNNETILCIPERKPLPCPDHLWRVLHDVAGEMPRC